MLKPLLLSIKFIKQREGEPSNNCHCYWFNLSMSIFKLYHKIKLIQGWNEVKSVINAVMLLLFRCNLIGALWTHTPESLFSFSPWSHDTKTIKKKHFALESLFINCHHAVISPFTNGYFSTWKEQMASSFLSKHLSTLKDTTGAVKEPPQTEPQTNDQVTLTVLSSYRKMRWSWNTPQQQSHIHLILFKIHLQIKDFLQSVCCGKIKL